MSDSRLGDQDDSDQEVNNERPLEAKPYLSTTIDETLKEISNFNTTNRPLIKMQFIKKRREFGSAYKYNEQDATERFIEIKGLQNDPLGHIKTKVVELGVQGFNRLQPSGTQTTWYRKINKGLQINDKEDVVDVADDDHELLKFFENVYPLMEEALQSNETIDIYQDDFNVIPQSDTTNNQTTDLSNLIKEIKSFSYLNCKGKKISCIQFQPSIQSQTLKSKSIVAESFVEMLSFDERIIYQLKSHKSSILFWDFDDVHSMDPALVLVSPLEILHFEFNPKDPNIVIGGAMNGQVILWDLSGTSLSAFATRKNQKSKQEKNDIQEILPKLTSALQDPSSVLASNTNEVLRKLVPSHKNPVLCIKWLPSSIEIDRKVFYNLITNNGIFCVYQNPYLLLANECHQFASISMDGQILFWDTRQQDKDPKKPFNDASQPPWKAINSIQLYRPEGGGQMGGQQLAFRKNQKTSTLTGTSDEGELFFLDWSIRPTDENPKADMVQQIWQNERSYRPIIQLDVSVFYDDIILTLHDFHFCVWKHGINIPVFESMIIKSAHITCGGFSPFRPAIIVVGKTDGNLDVWDLLDQSHKWTIQYNVVAQQLTSLKFHENQPQTVAVGDIDGTLHLLEFPGTLYRKQGDEEKSMQIFWNREVKRVEYYIERFKIREEVAKTEKQKRELEDQLEQQKEQTKHSHDEKKEDEQDIIEKEYQNFCKSYFSEKEGTKDDKNDPKQKKK